MTPPPGWYPDPQNGIQLRYWDGATWTEHAAPHDPPPTAPPPAAANKKPPLTTRFSALPAVARFAIMAVVAVLGVGLMAFFNSSPESEGGGGGEEPLRYTWENPVCTRDDYSGVFTNTDKRTFKGKVWATGTDEVGGRERDEEVIISLAPGASETVEFVWVLDGERPVCSLDSVEWYP